MTPAGSALAHPEDAAMVEEVRALLTKLAGDPANGIGALIDRAEIAARGGPADAAFMVNFAPGFKGGRAIGGPLITPAKNKGTHGYFPEWPEMRATFVISGAGVAQRRLGEIDMCDIAPTVARIMNVKLPTATGKPLF
jgi:hypothetical protein